MGREEESKKKEREKGRGEKNGGEDMASKGGTTEAAWPMKRCELCIL